MISVPCLRARGIVPKNWTTQAEPEDQNVKIILDHDILELWVQGGDIFLDGSGGKNSRDPRTRRAGFAWIQDNEVCGDPNTCIGMYSTLEGYQSVPRAELNAMISFFTFIAEVDLVPTHYRVHTDNKGVYLGYHKGPIKGYRNHGDLWEKLWFQYHRCTQKGFTFTIRKVKSRTDEADLEAGTITPAQRHGNDRADHWAGEAAK